MILRPMGAGHWNIRLYAARSSLPIRHLETTASLLPGADFTGYRNSSLCYVLTVRFTPKRTWEIGKELRAVWHILRCLPAGLSMSLNTSVPVSSKQTLNDSPALGQIIAPVPLPD